MSAAPGRTLPFPRRPWASSSMTSTLGWELCPDGAGGMTIRVLADVDADGARDLVRLATGLVGVTGVSVDLSAAGRVSADAAGLLLSGEHPGAPAVTLLDPADRCGEAILLASTGRWGWEPWADGAGSRRCG